MDGIRKRLYELLPDGAQQREFDARLHRARKSQKKGQIDHSIESYQSCLQFLDEHMKSSTSYAWYRSSVLLELVVVLRRRGDIEQARKLKEEAGQIRYEHVRQVLVEKKIEPTTAHEHLMIEHVLSRLSPHINIGISLTGGLFYFDDAPFDVVIAPRIENPVLKHRAGPLALLGAPSRCARG